MKWVMIILVAVGSFIGFFHGLIAAITHACIRSTNDLYFVSPAMDFFIVCICLGTAWLIGYFQQDIFAFRGIGTKFYGHENVKQGYVATKWLTAVIPLIPIRSYVIHYKLSEISKFDFESQKNVISPIEEYFHFPQMLRTAIISYGMILWCLGCLWVMFMAPCF